MVYGAKTERFVRMFEEAEEATLTARGNAERDRDYYDGKQLTDDEVKALRKRGQPPLVINRIRRKIDWLKGFEIQRRTEPKAVPRNPTSEHDANSATDSIRFVCDNVNWDKIRSAVHENLLIEGIGGVEVVHKQNGDEIEIEINRYNWDRLFYDPHSMEPDFSDARYKGAVIWMDAEELKGMKGVTGSEVEWTLQDAGTSETYDDRPKWSVWGDSRRKRVRVVLIYYKEGGKWHWCRYFKGGIIDKGESPYKDEDGNAVCPLIMASLYVDRDNNRYGVVRDMVDPQDEINKRRSKALHQLTMRQAVMEQGAVDSMEDVRRELARPDGIIIRQPDTVFEILDQSQLASGQMALLQEAKSEIDMMGANSALAGETGESASGRAVIAKQQGGIIEFASNMDRLSMFSKEVYEHIWMRVRQFWTEERWIRVTDDDRNVRFVSLNKPLTLADELREAPQEQAMMAARQLRLGPNDPRLGQVTRIQNHIAKLEVDIVVEEVPDQIAVSAEEFQALANMGPALIQSNPMYAAIVNEMLIETAPGLSADTRDKLRQMTQQIEQQNLQASAGAQQTEQMQGQVMLEKASADIRATTAKAAKDEASALQMLQGGVT